VLESKKILLFDFKFLLKSPLQLSFNGLGLLDSGGFPKGNPSLVSKAVFVVLILKGIYSGSKPNILFSSFLMFYCCL
jgi:hypothetical protein